MVSVNLNLELIILKGVILKCILREFLYDDYVNTYLDDWQSQIPPCFSKARIISSLLLYSSVDCKRSKIGHLLQFKDLIPINTTTKQINAKNKAVHNI